MAVLVVSIAVLAFGTGAVAQHKVDVIEFLSERFTVIPEFVSDGEQVVTSTALANSFNEIAEIAVEEYNFTNVGKFTEDNKKLLGVSLPFTDKSFLLTYSGTVKAGIRDLTAVTVDINDTDRTVTVSVPEVEVLEAWLDPSSIEVYDESFSPLNQLEITDITEFQAGEIDKAVETAVANGLLDTATTRAEDLITSHVSTFLANTPSADYTITVTWVEPAAE